MVIEKGDHTVEQSVAVEVQGEAPAPRNASGSTTPILPMQFSAQFAQQMATIFQQMAGNVPVQALVKMPPV